MSTTSKEKKLLEGIRLLVLGYEKETNNSVDTIVLNDDRGGTGNFHGTVICQGKSKSHAV